MKSHPLKLIPRIDFRLHTDKMSMRAAFNVGIIPTDTKTSSSSSSFARGGAAAASLARHKEQHHPITVVKHHRRHHHHLLRATKKGGPQKTEDTNKSSGKSTNFIKYQSKPYTDKDGDNPRPWYIDEASGKANGIVVIVVFLASQVFIGTVLQPLAVFINQLWEPIVGGNLYLDNIY